MKRLNLKSYKKLPRFLYLKLVRIHDTPQKIALGMGLGVFSGIIPGTGPIAALFLAFIFRANRATAILGSILTNTWLSFLTFILAIKAGSVILGMKWQQVRQDWLVFLKDFRWYYLFRLSALKIAFPVLLGYLAIAAALGLSAYVITLAVILAIKNKPHQHI